VDVNLSPLIPLEGLNLVGEGEDIRSRDGLVTVPFHQEENKH